MKKEGTVNLEGGKWQNYLVKESNFFTQPFKRVGLPRHLRGCLDFLSDQNLFQVPPICPPTLRCCWGLSPMPPSLVRSHFYHRAMCLPWTMCANLQRGSYLMLWNGQKTFRDFQSFSLWTRWHFWGCPGQSYLFSMPPSLTCPCTWPLGWQQRGFTHRPCQRTEWWLSWTTLGFFKNKLRNLSWCKWIQQSTLASRRLFYFQQVIST